MKQTFSNFLITNFQISVFVSLIVYKFFEIILDIFLTPVLYSVIDPQDKIQHKSVNIGKQTIHYGNAFRYILMLFIVTVMIYYLFRTK